MRLILETWRYMYWNLKIVMTPTWQPPVMIKLVLQQFLGFSSYTIKCAHLLIVFCITVDISWVSSDLCDLFTHIPQGCFTGTNMIILMVKCKKNVTPLLTHWSFVFLALTHRFDYYPVILSNHMIASVPVKHCWRICDILQIISSCIMYMISKSIYASTSCV